MKVSPASSFSIKSSISSSMESASLRPCELKNLIPLYSIGLCEADITAPISTLNFLVKYAIAGVGTIPASITSIPTLVNPDIRANFKVSFDILVSVPMIATGF